MMRATIQLWTDDGELFLEAQAPDLSGVLERDFRARGGLIADNVRLLGFKFEPFAELIPARRDKEYWVSAGLFDGHSVAPSVPSKIGTYAPPKRDL